MIVESRERLAGALAPLEWEVRTYEPSDVVEVPCVVVGRPTMAVEGTGQGSLFTITNPVWVMGRRLGDEDSVAELDAVTDQTLELVGTVSTVVNVLPTVRTV